MSPRKVLFASLSVLIALGLTGPAQSQAWPQKPVRIIYPYAAGSAGDAAARLTAQRLGEVFGQPFIVENRVGANGALAAEAVARSPADGHTLFWAASPQISIAPAMKKLSYDPVKDFAPISAVNTHTFVLVVNPRLPARTLAEFVGYVRAQPDKLAYAEGSVGSVGHLAMALFLKRAGLEMTNVSYKGNAPALTDVIAGHVPTTFSLIGDTLPHAKSGNIRLLAVSSERRAAQVPDVPTVSESGYPGYNAISWNGLLAPAGTPKLIVDRIAAEVGRAVKDAKFIERLSKIGVEPLGNSPDEFTALIAAEIPMWAEAVKIAGVGLQ